MDGLDGLGDAVTGGLLARAVEPVAGEAGSGDHTHEKNCLNCGSPLTGSFCSTCGQKAHVHRSVRGFFQELKVFTKNPDGSVSEKDIIPVRFVPMTGEAEERTTPESQ